MVSTSQTRHFADLKHTGRSIGDGAYDIIELFIKTKIRETDALIAVDEYRGWTEICKKGENSRIKGLS